MLAIINVKKKERIKMEGGPLDKGKKRLSSILNYIKLRTCIPKTIPELFHTTIIPIPLRAAHESYYFHKP